MYEITLRGALPAALTANFPLIASDPEPTATILSRQVSDSAEVDELIFRLRSVGITPHELHASSDCYEFRIDGELGDSTLRYVQWAFRLDQERTVMRVAASQEELPMILEELADSGVQIDRVIRCPAD